VKEAGEEAEHKAYCDKEMAETKQKMGELKYDLEKLSTKIDKASAKSVKLKSEVATLAKELAEMATRQAEADAVRQEEHKVYLDTKADLEQGIDGVRLALKVLRDYYASESDATTAAAAMSNNRQNLNPTRRRPGLELASLACLRWLSLILQKLRQAMRSRSSQRPSRTRRCLWKTGFQRS